MRRIYDGHAHLGTEEERRYREREGIVTMICAGDRAEAEALNRLSGDWIVKACGLHPWKADLGALAALEPWLERAGIIGEIGLDYHYDFSPREVQKRVFEAQLRLARDLQMPVIIHDREAHEDTLTLLRRYRPQGILHCFSGSAEMAREIVDLGMYVAFGGAVTFKNARKPLEAAAAVPMDRLLVETDCPYMAPEPLRGRRCDSSMIEFVANRLAQVKGIEPQALLDQTCENAKKVYKIESF